MQLEKGYIYHIYNQGNNWQKIFFQRRNYEFFRNKIKKHILPYGDILAYCLMPNHFHLMVLVRETETEIHPMTQSHRMNSQTINQSIAVMLRSYTRAINKQEGLSGSLFRQKTKAECVNCPKEVSHSFISKEGVTEMIQSLPEMQYPQVCFNYIHQNPVKAGLVHKEEDWVFSSAGFYSGLRNDDIVNLKVAAKYIDINSEFRSKRSPE